MLDQNTYDVIVVGGGIAGLTSSAYLAKNGLKTILFEKADKVGGLVNSFKYKGFTYDGGIRAFENSGILLPMLKQLGIDIPLVPNMVTIGIEQDFVRLKNRDSLFEYQSLLNKKFPENTKDIEKIINEIKKIMGYMDVLYGVDNPLFVDYMQDMKYIFKTLLPWLIKYQIKIDKVKNLNEPINEYLNKFTNNQSLIDVITQHFFKNTPTFFALSYFGLYLDYSYPFGGTGVLIDKIAEYIINNGGRLETKTEVVNIDVEKKIVKTNDGREFKYKKLIWCGDMRMLYSTIDKKTIRDKKTSEKIDLQGDLVNKNIGGDSILTIFMSVNLDKVYFENICGPHSFYTPNTKGQSKIEVNSWEEILSNDSLDELEKRNGIEKWVEQYLVLTTYEISCPSLRDPSLAPIGQTGLIISTLLDYRLVKYIADNGWYEEFKKFCEEKIVAVLSSSIFPTLKENMIEVQCSTPLTLERMTSNSEGAITGWAFTGGELPTENRFKQIANSVNTPIPNIYQAGQWSFSPSGLPVSILTGKLAVDAILKKLKNVSQDTHI